MERWQPLTLGETQHNWAMPVAHGQKAIDLEVTVKCVSPIESFSDATEGKMANFSVTAYIGVDEETYSVVLYCQLFCSLSMPLGPTQ